MEADVVDNREANRFELLVDGQRVGFLAYRVTPETMTFTEIETDLRLAGKGLGLILVRAALDAASAEALSVRPECQFVRDFIERHPVYLDLVPAAERAGFDLPPG